MVGNHDSITLFGTDLQSKVADVSKSVSEILLHGNDELEDILHEISTELETFQAPKAKTGIGGLLHNRINHNPIKKYFDILYFLDKASLAMKFQEAQLLKDSKVLEMIIPRLKDYSTQIGSLMEYGKSVLEKKAEMVGENRDESDLSKWYSRLQRRIEDLSITNTIANQNIVQMGLMLDNNRLIVDRILFALNGTIPTWRNQISILLGIEKMNNNMAVQKSAINVTEDYLEEKHKEIRRDIRKLKRGKEFDYDKLKSVNIKLDEAINALAEVEEKDKQIKNELRLNNV